MQKIYDIFFGQNKYIFKKYKTIKQIGYGAFGNVYSVIRLKDKKIFAMKTEKRNKESKLESEAYYLYTLQKGIGFPKLISYGHIINYNILIETLLGKSLYDIFISKNILCNIIEVCLIGNQILDRLEWIHSNNIIYRDIKPENFLIGINDPDIIYIIDFGLCKKYRSSKTGKHILPKTIGTMSGTLKYASLNVLNGKELSRRDDLISLGYMLIYLLKRNLPWECNIKNLNDLDESRINKIKELKKTNGNGLLFKNIPKELVEFIKYTKHLKFEQEPDYSYLHSLLNTNMFSKHLDNEKKCFSWINNKNDLNWQRNSFRKSSPFYRIFKNMKEKNIKDYNKESISEFRENNKLTLTSNFNKFSNIEKNFNNNSFDYDNKNIVKSKSSIIINEKTINKNDENEKEKILLSKKLNNKIKNSFPIRNSKILKNINETNYINYKNNAINKNKIINKSLIMNRKQIPTIKNYNFIINSKILYNINNNCKTIKNNNIFCDNNILSNKRKLNTQFNFFSNDINYKSPLLKHKMQKNLAINNKGINNYQKNNTLINDNDHIPNFQGNNTLINDIDLILKYQRNYTLINDNELIPNNLLTK